MVVVVVLHKRIGIGRRSNERLLNVMLPSAFLFLCKHCLFWFSAQIKLTVQGLFDLNQNIPAFKEHLRDFMVQIKVGDLNEQR